MNMHAAIIYTFAVVCIVVIYLASVGSNPCLTWKMEQPQGWQGSVKCYQGDVVDYR